MKKSLLTVITLILFQGLYCSANPLSEIDILAGKIAESNPEIKALALQAGEQAESLLAENILSDPTAEMEHLWGEGQLGNKLTIGISQEFQLPGIIRSRKKMASLIREESNAERKILFMEKRCEARQLLIRAIYGQRISTLCDSASRLSLQKADLLNEMLRKGEATRLDAYKAAVEATEARRMSESSSREMEDIQAALNELAGGVYIDISVLPTHIEMQAPGTIEEYDNYVTDANSVFSKLDILRSESSRQRLSIIKAERWPTVELGYIYNHEIGETYQGFSFGLTLPVYSRKHKKEAARLASEQISNYDQSRIESAKITIRQAYETATSLWSEIELLRDLLADDSDISLLNRMLSVNTLSMPEYLTEMAELLNIRRAHLETERDYLLAFTSLNRYKDL